MKTCESVSYGKSDALHNDGRAASMMPPKARDGGFVETALPAQASRCAKPGRWSLLYKAGCVVLFALSLGGVYAGTWQKVGDEWDGNFGDVDHWNGGLAQDGAQNRVEVQPAGTSYAVTVEKDTETTGQLLFDGSSTYPITLDATGHSLLFATQAVESATWPANAFYARFDYKSFFKSNSDDARWNKQAQAKFSDVSAKLWSPEAGVAELRFTGGTAGVLDFVHPDLRGDTKAPNGARPTVRLFEADYYQPDKSSYNHCRLTFDNVTAHLPSVMTFSYPCVSEFALANNSTLMCYGNITMGTKTNIVTLTNGSRFLCNGQVCSIQTEGVLRFDMDDASSVAFQAQPIGNSSRLVFNGGSVSPYTEVTELINLATSAQALLTNTCVSSTTEVKFSLSGQATLNAEDSAFTNGTKFTMKSTGDAAFHFDRCDLRTPLMAGGDSSRITLHDSHAVVDNWGLSKARVTLANVTLDSTVGVQFTGTDGIYVLSNVTGTVGSDTTTTPFLIGGSNVVTFTADDLDHRLVVWGNNHGQLGAGTYGELNIEGGTFEYRGKVLSHRFNLAASGEAYVGVLNVRGGCFVSKATSDGVSSSFGLGITHGTGYINVSGGVVDVAGLCICTEDNTSVDKESVFRQTGGLVKVAPCNYVASCQSRGLCATGNDKKTRKARIALDGGVTEVSVIAGGTSGTCRGGTGWTAFEANGGFVRVNGANAEILRDFDEAKLGAKGLTIDTQGYAVNVRQNLANAADASGRLVLTGTGTTTVHGTNAVAIVVAEGTLAFAATANNAAAALVVTNGATATFAAAGSAGRSWTSLTLGDDATRGRLVLRPTDSLRISDSVTIRPSIISFTSAPTTGMTYTNIVCAGAADAATCAAWTNLVVYGLASDQGCDLIVETAEDTTYFTVAVRAKQNQVIDVPTATTQEHTDDIVIAVNDTLTANVGETATLTVSGRVGTGKIVKTGPGKALFTNAEDNPIGGVQVTSGLLAFLEASVFTDPLMSFTTLTLGTGTLQLGKAGNAAKMLVTPFAINTTTASDAGVIKCDSDIALAAPTVAQGCLIKRGTGALTLQTRGTCTFSSNAGKDVKNTAPSAEAIAFDAYGTPPSTGYSSLTVAEGDLVLTGTDAAQYEMRELGATYVGMPVQDVAAPARLIVDGVKATFAGAHFHLGSGVRSSNCAYPNTSLVVTNGAAVSVTTLQIGWNGDTTSRPRLRVSGDGTTLATTEYLRLNQTTFYGFTEEDPTLLANDGASIMVSSNDGNINHGLACACASIGVFDRATLADIGYKGARIVGSGTNDRLIFRNKSRCIVNEVRGGTGSARLTLTFDDSEWTLHDATQLTLTNPNNIVVETRNAGLRLAPQAGTNLTFALPIGGAGGLVKAGEGVLTLAAAPSFTGVCRVEEGALMLADGLAAEHMTFAGAGRLTGGTFSNTTLCAPLSDESCVTGAVPVLAGATLVGRTRVDLMRTAENPVTEPWPKDVVVATYAGAAPNVSGWRPVNTGVKSLTGRFKAGNGQITMTLGRSGMMLIYQ